MGREEDAEVDGALSGGVSGRVRGVAVGVAVLVATLASVAVSVTRPPTASVRVEAVAPVSPLFIIESGLGSRRAMGGVEITATVLAFVSGLGVICGNCEPQEEAIGRQMGGRLFAVLQREATCAATPSRAGSRRGPLSVTSARPGKLGINLRPGQWRIRAVLPPGAVPRGKWRLCTWFLFSRNSPISNPAFPGVPAGFPESGAPWGIKGPYSRAESVRVP